MRKTRASQAVSAVVMASLLFCAHARAQDDGCKQVPIFTPARDSADDLRCFPQRIATNAARDGSGHASTFSIVLAAIGGAGVATFIGFGIAGEAQLGAGNVPQPTIDSVRVDYAIANVALSVGITALVTSIALMLTHR